MSIGRQRSVKLLALPSRSSPDKSLSLRAGKGKGISKRGQPAVIKMMYWYSHSLDQPELFDYSLSQLQADEQFFIKLIEQIKEAAQYNHFPLVV